MRACVCARAGANVWACLWAVAHTILQTRTARSAPACTHDQSYTCHAATCARRHEPTQAVQETGNTVYSYAQVQQLGGGSPAVPDPPKPGDLSTIMYTSGTTGACVCVPVGPVQ
jgi:long-subunit acyl-CoA synthetase (AMP-forming)